MSKATIMFLLLIGVGATNSGSWIITMHPPMSLSDMPLLTTASRLLRAEASESLLMFASALPIAVSSNFWDQYKYTRPTSMMSRACLQCLTVLLAVTALVGGLLNYFN